MMMLKERLLSAIKQGKAPHAIFLTGPLGSRTQEIAKEAASVCLNLPIDSLCHCPDYYELASPSVKVDEVRKLQSCLFDKPFGTWRCVLIPEAHNMTAGAQNALLKTLEEPPSNTLLLLCGKEEGLLPTILSRSMILRIGSESTSHVYESLMEEGISETNAKLAASLSGGLIGLAREYATDEYLTFREHAMEVLAKMLTPKKAPPFDAMKKLLELCPVAADSIKLTTSMIQRRAAEYALEIFTSMLADALHSHLSTSLYRNIDRLSSVDSIRNRFTIAQIQGIIKSMNDTSVRLASASAPLSMDRLVATVHSLHT